MNSFTILLIGMAVVIGAILVLRLHAFLALIFAALIVSALTPDDSVRQSVMRSAAVKVVEVHPSESAAVLKVGEKQQFIPGRNIVLEMKADGTLEQVGEAQLTLVKKEDDRYRVEFEQRETGWQLEPDQILLHHTQAAAARSAAARNIGERVATGFGNAALGIGILIAMAAIIGKCLLDSGAAERVVVSARNAVGEARTPLAFLGSGFVVGIPVFFDTVFYLLMPLGKAMRVRTGKNYLLYILSIVAGATMAHSLVPPTPGPLFVANELGVDLGFMMLGGGVVGLGCALSGFLFAHWLNRRMEVPLRPSAELTEAQLREMAERDESTLPPLWLSLLPILLPVVLIAGGTVVEMARGEVPPLLELLGNKNIALSIAAVIALVTVAWHKRASREGLAEGVQSALAGGGVIILITAAGGAFGHVLRQTDIAGEIQGYVPASQAGMALLLIAFAITSVVRVAQGSATVAMITAVGIVAPIAAAIELPYNRLYLALAVGSGSKPLTWMNDSGFWIISRMSGMTEAETLKSVTVMATIMGLVGLGLTLLGATLFPLNS